MAQQWRPGGQPLPGRGGGGRGRQGGAQGAPPPQPRGAGCSRDAAHGSSNSSGISAPPINTEITWNTCKLKISNRSKGQLNFKKDSKYKCCLVRLLYAPINKMRKKLRKYKKSKSIKIKKSNS